MSLVLHEVPRNVVKCIPYTYLINLSKFLSRTINLSKFPSKSDHADLHTPLKTEDVRMPTLSSLMARVVVITERCPNVTFAITSIPGPTSDDNIDIKKSPSFQRSNVYHQGHSLVILQSVLYLSEYAYGSFVLCFVVVISYNFLLGPCHLFSHISSTKLAFGSHLRCEGNFHDGWKRPPSWKLHMYNNGDTTALIRLIFLRGASLILRPSSYYLISPLMPHICVSESGQHWFR